MKRATKSHQEPHTHHDLLLILNLAIGQISITLSKSHQNIESLGQIFETCGHQLQQLSQKETLTGHELNAIHLTLSKSIPIFQDYDRFFQQLTHVASVLSRLKALLENKHQRISQTHWKTLQKNTLAEFTMESEKRLFNDLIKGIPLITAIKNAELLNEPHCDIDLF